MNFVYRVEGGVMHNFSNKPESSEVENQSVNLHTNDRFFMNQSHLFRFIGHLEEPNEKPDLKELQK